MNRQQILAALRAAAAEGDRKRWMRLYVENRVSLTVAMRCWREGEAMARWIAKRDASTPKP